MDEHRYEWFWSKVDRTGDCWAWKRATDRFGYGVVNLGHGKMGRSHRVAWAITNGPVPEGLLVCHRCDNPPCVNPAHLFLGTYGDNNRDRKAKGRSGKTGGAYVVGIDVATARLTDADVIEIRRLRHQGVALAPLAERFKVTKGTISKAATGISWKHV